MMWGVRFYRDKDQDFEGPPKSHLKRAQRNRQDEALDVNVYLGLGKGSTLMSVRYEGVLVMDV